MKETKIEIHAGCEVERIETQDGHVVVTFKEKKPRLPKTWEEFCEIYSNFAGEYFIEPERNEKICRVEAIMNGQSRTYSNAELLPDRATAEAVLALCQLIQLRNCYNGDWVPDWEDENRKYTIDFYEDEIFSGEVSSTPSILAFKSKELRDKFLCNFRSLIDELKPLYGIFEL